MPTKKRRVGFIPRIVVLEIIKKLSYENNLSNSKIINILVEEALSQRGIFDIKTGRANFRLERENEKKDVYSFLRNNRIKNKNTGFLNLEVFQVPLLPMLRLLQFHFRLNFEFYRIAF